MTKNDVWNLFMQTGKIIYYLKYKQMLEEENGTTEDRGNNS